MQLSEVLKAHPLSHLLGLDTHHHKCASRSCGMIWSHRQADTNSAEEHDAAHSCPKCGTQQIEKCEPDGTPYRATFKLTEREVSTIIAALFARGESLDDGNTDPHADIATQMGRMQALSANEIDHLADRLTRGG